MRTLHAAWGLGLALAFLAPLSALAATATFTHKTEGFSLQHPGDWTAQEDVAFQSFNIPFLAVRPAKAENEAFRENLNVVIEKISHKMTTEGYFKANLKTMPGALPEFKALNSGDLKGGATPGKYLVYRQNQGGLDLKAIVFFFVKKGQGYTLTCTSTLDQFDLYQKLFLQVGKTFKP